MDARQRWHHVLQLLDGVANLIAVLKADGHAPSAEQMDAIGRLVDTIRRNATDQPEQET